jgi:uncharacterized protein (DUF1015 family)
MADIRPFSGIQYAPELRPHLAALVTPPYDVISPEAQAAYYDRHPNNIIRLELGLDEPGDDTLNNRYTRAAATFADWRLRGIMRQDERPAMYLYRQRFHIGGKDYWRASLLARVRLEPWEAGVVLPHEKTLAKPKSDRLKLLRACAANLSPIMALYQDEKETLQQLFKALNEFAPEADFTDEAGEEHWLLPITDESHIRTIQDFFIDQRLYIADGHHRYETALAYRDELREMRKELPPEDAANFVLMSLSAFEDPGVVILPTHRLIKGVAAERVRSLAEVLKPYFIIEVLPSSASATQALDALTAEAGAAFVFVTAEQTFRLRARPEVAQHMAATGRSAGWQTLDVAILQTLALEEGLGLDAEAMTSGDFLTYIRDADAAVAAVQNGKAQLAALVRPTRVEQLRDVAAAGDRMPQKSTYFYPKLITGLVINPLW